MRRWTPAANARLRERPQVRQRPADNQAMRTAFRVLTCALLLTACDEAMDEPEQDDAGDGSAAAVGDAEARGDAGQDDATAMQESDASEAQDAGADAGRELVRFSRVWSEVLELRTCVGCHPTVAADRALDLSSIEKAYLSLVDPAPKCIGKPYVTPGKPAASLLLDVIAIPIPSCDITRMPDGSELTREQVALLRQWVADGALR